MAASREIPIKVHPEFRRRAMSEGFAGKSRLFTRSASLPGEPPRLKVVVENLTPSGSIQGAYAAQKPNQGTHRTPDKEGMKEWNYIDDNNFWEADVPVNFRYPNVENLMKQASRRQNDTGLGERRRYYVNGNPFIGDFDKVFGNHISGTKLPVAVKRSQTFSADNSHGKDHEKISDDSSVGLDTEQELFVTIPINKVADEVSIEEQNEKENGNTGGKGNGVENERVIRQDERIAPIPEITEEAQVHEKSDTTDDNYVSLQGRDDSDTCTEKETVSENPSTAEQMEKGTETHENNVKSTVREEEKHNEEKNKVEQPLSAEMTEPEEGSEEKISRIQSIHRKAEELGKNVEAFGSDKSTKEYLYLEELLTRYMIELDGIEANGDESVRIERKAAVKQLQKTLVQLEQRIAQKSDQKEKGQETLETKENEKHCKEDQ